MSLKIPYGLKEGKLVHISEIQPEEAGLKCNCHCPSPFCNDRLIAKIKGQSKSIHFAHYKSENCPHGLQTALHIAAKDIIAKAKTFVTPGYSHYVYAQQKLTTGEYEIYKRLGYGEFDVVESVKEKKIRIDNVYLEKIVDDFIPDIILVCGQKRLLVEIAVTHFVDEIKMQKIRAARLAVIEVDLSKMSRTFNRMDLEKLLLEGPENKTWLFNGKIDEQANAAQKVMKSRVQLHIKEQNEYYLRIRKEQESQEAEKRENLLKTPTLFHKTIYSGVEYLTLNNGESKENYVQDCYEKNRVKPDWDPQNSFLSDCFKCEYFKGLFDNGKKMICMGELERRMRNFW